MGAATLTHPSFGMTTTQAIRDLFAWRIPNILHPRTACISPEAVYKIAFSYKLTLQTYPKCSWWILEDWTPAAASLLGGQGSQQVYSEMNIKHMKFCVSWDFLLYGRYTRYTIDYRQKHGLAMFPFRSVLDCSRSLCFIGLLIQPSNTITTTPRQTFGLDLGIWPWPWNLTLILYQVKRCR